MDKIIVHNLRAKELIVGDIVVAITLIEDARFSAKYSTFTVSRNLDAEVRELLKDAVL